MLNTKQDVKTGRFTKITNLEDRFWSKVKKDTPDTCWEWQGSRLRSGYGKMRDADKRQRPATHISWFLATGAYPTDFMCHKCDNPPCVNPNHLFEGTIYDNLQDMVQKRRHRFGQKSHNAVLTEDMVRDIKRELTGKQGECTRLGKKYHVGYSTISKIRTGKQWAHVQI